MAQRIAPNGNPEFVYGEEPENNGDYSWCETCHAHVELEFWQGVVQEDGFNEYFHVTPSNPTPHH